MKDGKPFIVEYYELSEEMAYEKNERGEYAYNYGVTLNYMFPVDKLMNLLDKKMPLHVVKKMKVSLLSLRNQTVISLRLLPLI